jgi:NAD(P)-dependent dehydrogenase (short-subunit alcohol dehydrogenase family)
LVGKTIVVTGATSGLGQAAARALARRGAHVIGVGRSDTRCRDARQSICAAAEATDLSFAVADLGSQRQVVGLADDIRALVEAEDGGKVAALVNNAGTVSSWRQVTEDGYELQFAVNHLAPFLLTHLLMPLLQRAPSARVVTVGSTAHRRARIHWGDLMYRRHYTILAAYKQSKLANVLFTAELNRRLGDDASVRAYVADPGLVNTRIGLKGTSGLERLVWRWRSRRGATPAEGAKTIIMLAGDSALEDAQEIYWKEGRPQAPSPRALDRAAAERLWAISARLCGLDGSPSW